MRSLSAAVTGAALLAAVLPVAAGAQDGAPTCAGQPATIVGTPGADELVGTSGSDVIVGLGGNDVIVGRGGDDLLCGGPGRDEMRGGRGNDVIVGGRADDRLFGGGGNDTLRGGGGQDFAYGNTGRDRLFGQKGHDQLWGDRGRDTAVGGIGDDMCIAEARRGCGPDTRSPAELARAFVDAAVNRTPLIHLFSGKEVVGRFPDDLRLVPVDPRPMVVEAYQFFEKYRGEPYLVLGLTSQTCSESLGGDLSYPCQFTVFAPAVGADQVILTLAFSQRILGWSPG